MKRFLPALCALSAACGTDVTGPSSSLMACVFGEPTELATGEILQVQGPANQGVCLAGDDGAEFLYIPFYGTADTSAELSLDLTGAGLSQSRAPVSIAFGDPLGSAGLRATGYEVDHTFHDRLRRRERLELGPRIRSGAPKPQAASRATADVPTLGEIRRFNVAISCDSTDLRTGRVVYVSDHAVVYADTANPADLSPTDYAFFGVTFDTLVHPLETAHFGEPTDIDGNGRAILFFTRAVNELTPAGSESVTIGFFWSGDLFPETSTDRLEACRQSNHGEMFYLIAPDPAGEVGVRLPLDKVRDLTLPLIGHEYQHLINASRRLFVNQATTFEIGWLNEGLSHVAEELLYLSVSGLEAGTNITIDDVRNAPGPADSTNFYRYMVPNLLNYARYMQNPGAESVMGPPNRLTTRGAAWAFLRYAADRSERGDANFFFDVVNGTDAGVDNLDRVLGEGAGGTFRWMRDWTVSIFADDFVTGVPPRFTMSSWNLRTIYAGYPLHVRELVNRTTTSVDLMAGGATFNRFSGATGKRMVIDVQTGSSAPPSALRGSFLRMP